MKNKLILRMKFLRHKTNNNIVLLDYEMHEHYYAGSLLRLGHSDDTTLRPGEYREDWSKDDYEIITEPYTILLFNMDLLDQVNNQDHLKNII